MSTITNINGFIGSGNFLFNRYVSGAYQGYVKMGNCTAFSITPAANIVQRVSREKNTYGQIKESVAIPTPVSLSVSVNGLSPEVQAISLMGTLVSQTQSALTAQAITFGAGGCPPVVLDTWIPIIHSTKQVRNISTIALVDGDSASLTLGTDYSIDKESGLIYFHSDGPVGVADAEAVVATVAAAETVQDVIQGGTEPQITGKVILDGENLATGEAVYLECSQVTFSPTSANEMISEDFTSLTLDGSIETPEGSLYGYTITRYAVG